MSIASNKMKCSDFSNQRYVNQVDVLVQGTDSGVTLCTT